MDPAFAGSHQAALAAKTAQLAENLPDGVALKNAHLADLLSGFVSRGQGNCNRFVINRQPVNPANDGL